MLAVLQYNFPVFSSVLLLIAGILIGYALWIPFRGDSESILRQLDGLADQNDDLEDALKEQRNAYVKLERRHAQQQDEWAYLRTWHERVESTLTDQGLAAGSIEQGLSALHDLREHAIKELDIERKRRTDVEDELVATKKTVENLQVNLEDYRNLQSKYEGLNSDFISIRQEHSQLRGEHEKLKEQAVVEADEQAQLVAGLQQSLSESDSVEAGEGRFEAQIESLNRALEEQRARADELHQDRTEILTQLQNERDQRCDLEEVLQEKERELKLANSESKELSESRVMELEETLHTAQNEFQQLVTERDMTVSRLDAAHAKIDQLESEVSSHRRAFDTVERHRSELELNSRRETESRQAEAQELQRVQQENGQIKAELALMHTLKQQNASLDRQYNSLQESHQDTQRSLSLLKTERDESALLLAEERTQREEIANRINRHLLEVDNLREQREEVLRNLREEQSLRREAERSLDEQTRRLAQVGREVSDVVDLREEVHSLRNQLRVAQTQFEETRVEHHQAHGIVESARETINSLQSQLAASQQSIQTLKMNGQGLQERYDERIDQLTMERNHARESVELAEEKLAELQDQMAELRSTVAELRREREDVLTRLRRQTVMLESHMAENQVAEIAEEHRVNGDVRRDERRGVVYNSRPGQVDDLKRISGIAAVLEKKLNEFGIYTYRQIMDWDEAAVEEFSTLLAFRDRIQRDDWMGQARHLYEEKYSKAA